ncbi:MAG: XTP/dITP diphosphatase [Candidatus Bilamarchaeaceae archaeon]
MEIYFATSNTNKFREAQEVFVVNAPRITLKHFQFTHREIRSDSLEEIATEATEAAFRRLQKPVFTEDTGLFVDALNGFPGTYSAWVQEKIGRKGILKLLEGVENRAARFEACIAFHNGSSILLFKGICEGRIAETERGKSGFGYDPIFIPEAHDATFAENIELKNKLSHRYKAISLLIDYLKNNQKMHNYTTRKV